MSEFRNRWRFYIHNFSIGIQFFKKWRNCFCWLRSFNNLSCNKIWKFAVSKLSCPCKPLVLFLANKTFIHKQMPEAFHLFTNWTVKRICIILVSINLFLYKDTVIKAVIFNFWTRENMIHIVNVLIVQFRQIYRFSRVHTLAELSIVKIQSVSFKFIIRCFFKRFPEFARILTAFFI